MGRHTLPGKHACLLAFTLFIVFALSIAPTIAYGSLESERFNQSSTEITACQRITESGTFTLTQDLEGNDDGPCIEIIRADSVVIDGNGYTINEGLAGVDVRGSSNVTIKNLHVNGSVEYGIRIVSSESVAIHGNNLSDIGRNSGPKVRFDVGIFSWDSTDIEIYENTIVNTSNVGIRLVRTNDAYISENKVINTHWWSIMTSKGKDIVLDRNTVENPETDANAIAFSDVVNVTVTNNYVNKTRYGIEAKPNSTDVVIRKNEIRNTVLCSIEAEGHHPEESENLEPGRVSNVLIEDNYIESAGPLGVWVNTSDIIVRNNTVKNASGLGMYYKGANKDVEIYGNLFFNSTSAAIRMDATHGGLRIYENEFRQLETGLQVVNSTDIRIERNQFVEVYQPFEERNTSGIDEINNTIETPGQPIEERTTSRIDDDGTTIETPGQPGFDIGITLFAWLIAVGFAWKRIAD